MEKGAILTLIEREIDDIADDIINNINIEKLNREYNLYNNRKIEATFMSHLNSLKDIEKRLAISFVYII